MLSVTKGRPTQRPFHLETKAFVQTDRRLVVDEHGQFDPNQGQPLVRHLQRRSHQGFPDPTPLPVVPHRHAQGGHMPNPRLVRMGVQPQHPHRLLLDTGQQADHSGGRALLQTLPPDVC